GRAPFRLVIALDFLGRRLAPPGFAAVRAATGDGVQLALFEGSEDQVPEPMQSFQAARLDSTIYIASTPSMGAGGDLRAFSLSCSCRVRAINLAINSRSRSLAACAAAEAGRTVVSPG